MDDDAPAPSRDAAPSTSGSVPRGDITVLLHAWSDGKPDALERLTPLVYDQLQRIARGYFMRESQSHTLQPTAVVNELFLDLMNRRRVQWQDRAQFFGFAARQMRRILVDHARRRTAVKRGGDAIPISLDALADDGILLQADMSDNELLRLDIALEDLARFNPEGGRIVEMRFFAGLTHDEIAAVLNVSTSTVRYKWRAAKSWLHRALQPS